ncbi:MAG: response regulator transcription factor [Nitrospirae bacterium]|nr:response regulator transcription factor [Nitrospirota bacterium]
MIKVAIVDDHRMVLDGLKQILSHEPDIEVVGEACNAEEGVGCILRQDIDIAILDISLPDKSGLDILDIVKTQKPKLRVLILSAFPEEQYAVRALKSGASGYLTKNSAPQELVDAIRRINSGGKYITAALAEKLTDILISDDKMPHERLSNREFEIMLMIAAGKTTGEIAEILFISPSTVGTYRSRIMEKMAMKTNADLTRYVVENRLNG